jgi:hypothetical protein
MPWYEYVCDGCGKKVVRMASIKHRDLAPAHREDGCWGGAFVRSAAVQRPKAPGAQSGHTHAVAAIAPSDEDHAPDARQAGDAADPTGHPHASRGARTAE